MPDLEDTLTTLNGGTVADERSSEERAYERGAEMANLLSDIREVRAHQISQNGALDRAATALEKYGRCQEEILGRLDERDTIEKEREKVAEGERKAAGEARAEQVNKRTFVTTAIGIVISLAALFASAVYYLGSTQ